MNTLSIIKTFIFYLIVLLAIIFSFFNLEYSRDFKDYNFEYNNISESRFEPLFLLIFHISKNILELSLQSLFFFISTITLLLKLYIARGLATTSNKIIFFTIIYIFSFYLLHDLTQQRLSIAVCFIILSIPYTIRKNLFTSILLIITATLFHLSSIIFIVLPILSYFYKSNRFTLIFSLFILMTILGFITFEYSADFIMSMRGSTTGYFNNWHNYSINMFTPPKILLYIIIFTFLVKNIKNNNYNMHIMFFYTLLPLCISIIFTKSPEISIRFWDLSALFSLFLFLLNPIKKTFFDYLILLSFLLLFTYLIYGFIFYNPLF
ncbi:EpsG family protein [Providencia sp. PROV114]|uniref:EpsG family protein n=1 Tax=Providencia sp. PROV114 TaxID=2949825 RepID=UPI00397784AE